MESDDSSSSIDDTLEDLEESKQSNLESQLERRRSFIRPSKSYREIPQAQLERQMSDVKFSKKGVNVFVRFRPDNLKEVSEGVDCITLDPNQKDIGVENDGGTHGFRFKRVFPQQTTQEEIFVSCALPLVDSVLDGFNAAILAYGQTGSGKTYTLLGPGFDNAAHIGRSDQELRGVTPRLIQAIFHQVYSQLGGEVLYEIYASYIQIYMEKVSDLINPAKHKLEIYNSPDKNLWLTDATKTPVKNVKEVLEILELGAKNRVTAATNSNAESSRSHALLVLTIDKHQLQEGKMKSSQVYLVDLCGSEKVSKTGATDLRLKEAQTINKSLLSLGNVIQALVDKKKHVPYRDSKLTRLLQNSFGGNSITSLILCCSSNSYNSLETLSTLRFGDRANKVHNKPVANQMLSLFELKRLLLNANNKISNMASIIRNLNDKLLQQESLIQHLYSILTVAQVKAIRSRYKVEVTSNAKAGITKLGVNVLIYVYSFLDVSEIVKNFQVCTYLNLKLRHDALWRFQLKRKIFGQTTLDGIPNPSLADSNFKDVEIDTVSSCFEYFRSRFITVYKNKIEAMRPHTASGPTSGLSLRFSSQR
mmetsp:Transcript_617/g.1071  ORF Transcript_617/g.1071 Transcript_617/m.1071 type:complete len:590 (-) Transcript_617:327-2096(-)|eukprot:CAMPEP_0204907556 /NCGR_PEP_ID=MMETSP1397-20131031/6678_1 /ASSEMBLY_ACC=CAM_ASM_000891 /TAXON_ID=49980 /ORGANISM="Climacostomum Climacostomum virens, Strain Stock W-24" /LENGTH=589 /DNA_ID=CAMNT_0052076751 /DNA_START=870 /DNA_END=2639 /DNA_ORIENTATION=-